MHEIIEDPCNIGVLCEIFRGLYRIILCEAGPSTALSNRARAEMRGGTTEPVLAGVAPGSKIVDFRPTSGPPSLLVAVVLKTKKRHPDICPISPTKQEPTDGEVSCPAIFHRLRRFPGEFRTPDMLACFALALLAMLARYACLLCFCFACYACPICLLCLLAMLCLRGPLPGRAPPRGWETCSAQGLTDGEVSCPAIFH